MSKVLFFFTSEYPFGTGETFIENEMPFLAQAFDKIVIISNNCEGKQTRQVPDNVIIKRFPYELNKVQSLSSILNVFNPLFWKEIAYIKNVYNKILTLLIVKTALISLQKSIVFKSHFSKIINENSSSEDTIVAYSYWANDTAFALSQMKSDFPRIRMIARAHRWDIYFEENKADYLPYRLPILKKLDNLFVISQDGKMYIESLLKSEFSSLKISRLGVKPHSISPVPKDDFIIVSISNIIPVKNIKSLILALSKLNFDFTWYHIGNGPLREELEDLSQKTIPNKFHFLGQMSNIEVIAFLQNTAISVFVNISLSEGIPVSIMEAISCGIPVIASNVGGNAEIINNQNGLFLSSNPSPEEIAQAITSFKILSESQRLEMKENAYKSWNENYNAEKNYQDFVNKILNL